MEFNSILKLRQSVRAFKDMPVPHDKIKEIVAAGQQAPIAMGDSKTTHITVVTDPEALNVIREASMLKRKDGSLVDAFYGATTMIFLSAADLSEDCIEYSNVACIIENMLLKATDLGLGSTYIWGCLNKVRNDSKAMEVLGLPEGYEILSAVAIGYPVRNLTEREYKEEIEVTWI